MAGAANNVCALLAVFVGLLGLSASGKTPFWHALKVPAVDIYILPILMFEDNGLEPYITEETVLAHHEGHVENYRKKMNAVLKQWRDVDPKSKFNNRNLIEIMRNIDIAPTVLRYDLTSNMGGYVNHMLYWANMSPNPEGVDRFPTGKLLDDINKEFGSFEKFKRKFTDKAMAVFGSGYVWLCRAKRNTDSLIIRATANQDSTVTYDLNPILTLDVWEHAYYLKHQFRRASYVADWWMLVDWELVAELDQWWADYDVEKVKADAAKLEAEKQAHHEETMEEIRKYEEEMASRPAEDDTEAPSYGESQEATPAETETGYQPQEPATDIERELEELEKEVDKLERLSRGEKVEL